MNLKKKIKEKGFTLTELAAAMTPPVTKATMSQIVNGNPTRDKLQQIANALGITLSELVSEPSDGALTALIDREGQLYRASSLTELKALVAKWDAEEAGSAGE